MEWWQWAIVGYSSLLFIAVLSGFMIWMREEQREIEFGWTDGDS